MRTKDGTRSARRVVYERERAPIPEGHVLAVLCEVAACVNPDHLEPITHAEALRRRGIPARAPRPKRDVCQRGHPWTPENTIIYAKGRQCRACKQETQRAYYARRVAANNANPAIAPSPTDPPETQKRCRQGHLIAGENVSMRPDGFVRCRICVKDIALRSRHRRKQIKQTTPA